MSHSKKVNKAYLQWKEENPEGFYNTTNETGDQLKEYTLKAGSQTMIILDYFRERPGQEFSPGDIWSFIDSFRATPITSIRRAMTVLTKHGFLIKTQNKKKGLYGRPECTWRLCAPWLDKIYSEGEEDLREKCEQAHRDTQMDLFKEIGDALQEGIELEKNAHLREGTRLNATWTKYLKGELSNE